MRVVIGYPCNNNTPKKPRRGNEAVGMPGSGINDGYWIRNDGRSALVKSSQIAAWQRQNPALGHRLSVSAAFAASVVICTLQTERCNCSIENISINSSQVFCSCRSSSFHSAPQTVIHATLPWMLRSSTGNPLRAFELVAWLLPKPPRSLGATRTNRYSSSTG